MIAKCVLLVFGATVIATGTVPAQACRLPKSDSAWVASALAGWTRTAARDVGIGVKRSPVLVFFDEKCTHTLVPTSGSRREGLVAARLRFTVSSAGHGDSIALPNGTNIPMGLTSFASPQPDGRMFFVMSLPSIWMTSGRGPHADLLATAVFMHEFTHTQTVALSARIDTVVAHGLPEDSDDDVIQKRFGKRDGYAAGYERERDLLFAAAAAPSIARARALAGEALQAIEQRRAHWFTGEDTVYADAEDLFLSLEGTGQWSAYRWLVDPKGGAMAPADALPFMRRGGRQWSQDEGLALLLTVHRLSPASPKMLYRDRPKTILAVLRELVQARRARTP